MKIVHTPDARQAAATDPADTSLTADENAPILKMAERDDWALFRSVEGLQQKAGVTAGRLRRLVLKEIADNALDTGSKINAGILDGGRYFVEDDGPGLDGTPEEIASLFSIKRPMRSSKLVRLPQRGALGNGLRVVAGAVLASQGSLTVTTRNQRIKLRPEADGSTSVVSVTAAKRPVGTRIEIKLGSALAADDDPFAWARAAMEIADNGKHYDGKSSPYWYDPAQFHELILAHGSQPLRSLIGRLDGCTGGKAGEITAAAGLGRATCESISRRRAATLLETARKHVRPVNPERLGCVLIRLLGSDRDGEVIASMHALRRVLSGAGLDLNDLAIMIEVPVQSYEPLCPPPDCWRAMANACADRETAP